MRCRHPHRFFTTLLVVMSLLFSQLALANYVCPTGGSQQREAVMEMAPGEPCEGMASDESQPVLCYQHCANAPQSDAVKLPTISLPAVVQVLLVPLILDVEASESAVFAQVGRTRPPSDPLFLSTLRLRV